MGEWPFPPIAGVTEIPLLREDGAIVDRPGYDNRTRLLYSPPPGLILPPILAKPTAEEIRFACDRFRNILTDFPFINQAARANMLGLILTPLLRPLIAGQVPLALIDKPKRGSGATLLAQVVMTLACGRVEGLTTAPTSADEWRKKITSLLRPAPRVICFDNVEHKLSSADLAAALTSPVWTDRLLGLSEVVSIPQHATWTATGNNLRVGGDLARRCYWIRLDAGVAEPWRRTDFLHDDLLRYVRRHRGPLIASALTLGRAWLQAGRPAGQVPIIGGFENWAETVGGVLAFAEVEGFLTNLDDLYAEIDDDEAVWDRLLAALHTVYGEDPWTVARFTRDLCEEQFSSAQHARLLRCLPDDLAEVVQQPWEWSRAKFVRRLGKLLARHADAVFGRFRLERAGTSHSAVRWRVVEVRGSSGSQGRVGK
jgi:hypothetical protein